MRRGRVVQISGDSGTYTFNFRGMSTEDLQKVAECIQAEIDWRQS